MMATFREAVASLGVSDREGQETIVVRKGERGMHHVRLLDCADDPIPEDADFYVASGRFAPGTVSRSSGRRSENLASVAILGFDFDLAPWLDEQPEVVLAMSDGEVHSLCQSMRKHVEEILAETAIPVHTLAYTGHGLLGVMRLGDNGPDDVPAIGEAYKAIIARINAAAGQELADRQVSDAGTRILRLPLSRNCKGGNRRPTEVIWDHPGVVDLDELARIAGTATKLRRDRLRALPTPTTGSLSSDGITALAGHFRRLWTEGKRHEVALAIGGLCAKAGVKEEDAAAIVEQLADGVEGEDRRTAVRTSYSRHERGLDTRGWYAVRDELSASELVAVEAILDQVRPATGVTLKMGTHRVGDGAAPGEVPTFESSFTVTPFPDAAWYGWFRQYREIAEPTTEAAEQYHLGCALAVAGAMIGRQVALDFGEGLFVNQFVLLLGLSGSSKKDSAIRRVISLPGIREKVRRTTETPFYGLARNVTSGEGLVALLADQPNQLCYISEINKLLSIAQRKGSGGVLDTLLESWDTPPVLEVNSIRARADKGSRAILPFVSVIAAGQPGRFADMIRDEDIFSGFANRWLYIPGIGGLNRKLAKEGALPEDAAVELYEALRRAIIGYQTYGTQYTMPMTSEAEALNAEWYDRINRSKGYDEAEASMRERHQVIGLKIATVYAVSDGARYLERAHLEAAIALVEWSWENIRNLMRLWGVSVTHKLEARIIHVLTRRGPMSRRSLQQQCTSRAWTAGDFGKALDGLIRNDLVQVAGGELGIPDG
jgi:hypothetical protein